MTLENLVNLAWSARERAYAPYSKFKVGAAIQTLAGDVFFGCNVEIANYGCTLCAERTAIVKAVSEGKLQPGQLSLVVVATQTSRPTAPCGSCRQVIEEFAAPDARVYMSCTPGRIDLEAAHTELLPHSFNGSHIQ